MASFAVTPPAYNRAMTHPTETCPTCGADVSSNVVHLFTEDDHGQFTRPTTTCACRAVLARERDDDPWEELLPISA